MEVVEEARRLTVNSLHERVIEVTGKLMVSSTIIILVFLDKFPVKI